MIIVRKKPFFLGVALLAGFLVIFCVILTPLIPVEGEKLNGLQFSDQVFNELSKGSSNFLYMAREASASMRGKIATLDIPLKNGAQGQIEQRLLANAHAEDVNSDSGRLAFKVDLGILLGQATSDSALFYDNEEDRLFAKYSGLEPLEVSRAWWDLLTPVARQLQLRGETAASNAVDTVIRRALEPGNNYFGIPAKKISDNIPLISFFLLFYIIYTVWYGFAIYEIFSGLGLMATSAEEEISEE